MEGKELRQEIDRILEQQKAKGLKVWQIACSLFAKGFKESEAGFIMGFHAKTAHAQKIAKTKGGKQRREIKNYLVLSARDMSHFLKCCKELVKKETNKNSRP